MLVKPMKPMVGIPIIWGWFRCELPDIWGWNYRSSGDGSDANYRTSGDGSPDNGGWFQLASHALIEVAPFLTIRTFAERTQQPLPEWCCLFFQGWKK
jgi:hypothetical protein